MIKTNEENSQYLENPRRELYESRDNIDVYRNVFLEISEDLSSNWIKYDFKRTYYYDFKKKVIISNRDRINNDIKLDSFRLFTFNVNQYSRNKVISKYKQMIKERNYQNLDFSWDELYTEVHFIFKKKIEKLHTIVIPDVSYSNDQLSFRLIDGEFCYTEVDSNVLITAFVALNMTYSDKLIPFDKLRKFERLIEKYDISLQEVNYFFDTNTHNMLFYPRKNILLICKFASKDKALEIIKNLLLENEFSRGLSKETLVRWMSIDGYVNDEGIQFFIDYIQNFHSN